MKYKWTYDSFPCPGFTRLRPSGPEVKRFVFTSGWGASAASSTAGSWWWWSASSSPPPPPSAGPSRPPTWSPPRRSWSWSWMSWSRKGQKEKEKGTQVWSAHRTIMVLKWFFKRLCGSTKNQHRLENHFFRLRHLYRFFEELFKEMVP